MKRKEKKKTTQNESELSMYFFPFLPKVEKKYITMSKEFSSFLLKY